jgi:hypothetical protein
MPVIRLPCFPSQPASLDGLLLAKMSDEEENEECCRVGTFDFSLGYSPDDVLDVELEAFPLSSTAQITII